MLKKNNNINTYILLGVILITFGITLLSNNYIVTKREEAFNKMNLSLLDNMPEAKEEDEQPAEETPTTEESKEEVKKIDYEPYIAVLKIPKINLERGFYDKNSSLNNVDYNILFHTASNYPSEEKGNVILASHSGSSSISYFKKLYLLEKGDIAYLTYKGTTYTYEIVNIYNEEKTGSINIYRNKEKNTLTLITCTKDDDTKQTVYILERRG